VCLLLAVNSWAQADTINTQTGKLKTAALQEGQASYVVFFTDSAGNRTSSADIWDRSVGFGKTADGQKTYQFHWKAYRKDSLMMDVAATGLLANMQPLTHSGTYPTLKRSLSVVWNNGVVTVPEDQRHTAKDSAFRVVMEHPAFEFPMDLELFALLPFKKTGQQFAMAFYEPGSAASAYYPLTVTGKEDLLLAGGEKASCWLLRIDYKPNAYATFWIADKTRQVLKMKEYFNGRYRYKVRLY
ncbi:MAG TPA: hypothetical protein VFL47_13460, partial [Flavisolibacter sp.]|nr:hypothetical protein [Flavisolibacter sp.]